MKLELDALKDLNFDISLTGFDDYKFTAEEIANDNFNAEEVLDEAYRRFKFDYSILQEALRLSDEDFSRRNSINF